MRPGGLSVQRCLFVAHDPRRTPQAGERDCRSHQAQFVTDSSRREVKMVRFEKAKKLTKALAKRKPK